LAVQVDRKLLYCTKRNTSQGATIMQILFYLMLAVVEQMFDNGLDENLRGLGTFKVEI
jgi:hypothetical protein